MSRILVIDDENNIRLMMRLALQAAHYEVETASDGLEGLGKFAADNFDLVLLDQRMPGIDGLDVLREMKQRDSSARVIMISAFGTIDLATEAIKAGAVDFLRKPFTTEVLRASVEAALGNSTAKAAENELPNALFSNAAINGFRITSSTRCQPANGDALRFSFEITNDDAVSRCDVVLPPYFVELVKAHADCETLPDAEHFWLWLSEESLANYLWQNAETPPNGVLQVEELSTALRRWIDAVLSE